MLDFGFSEVVLTSLVALVVLGPEKLPKVARQVGSWMGRARHMARQLTEQLEREVNAEELLRESKNKPRPPPLSPDPAPFDTSAFPHATHETTTTTPLESTLPVSAAPAYSADPATPPPGADWQPAPSDPKPPHE